MPSPYHHRLIESRLRRLATRFPVVMVTGARQTGKSTLLAHLFGAKASSFTFDPMQDIAGARRDPELFLQLNPAPLILDEVQYAPELLGALKRSVDKHKEPGRYFLTGSQHFGVMRGVQESLAGRVGIVDLLPMSASELRHESQAGRGVLELLLSSSSVHTLAASPQTPRQGPDLLQAIYRGGYPGLLPFETPELPDWFSSYFRTYVERDVPALHAISDARTFTRFAQLLATLTAQELNFSHLGRELGITRQTARTWLDLFLDGYQALQLPAWSGNLAKRAASRPKVYLQDTGMACWLLAVSSPRALNAQPNLGALFETWVVTELMRQAQTLQARPRFWHWRSRGGAEVDLILERDGVLHLIEVKLASRPSRKACSGMQAFRRANPSVRIGHQVVVHGGDEAWPLDEHTIALSWTAL